VIIIFQIDDGMRRIESSHVTNRNQLPICIGDGRLQEAMTIAFTAVFSYILNLT